MEPEYEWYRLLVLSQLSEYGKGQLQNMSMETQEALVFDAMMSKIFKEVFPTIQA